MTIIGEASIIIRPDTVGFARDAEAQVDGALGGLGSGKSVLALGAIGAGVIAVAAESVKMASDFQASMALIQTNAGVAAGDVHKLSGEVLGLAGQVGVGPTSLSEALYHIESSFASTGISGQRAMSILKIAAEGARLGHANLVDVTNALDGAIVASIPGAENFEKAMGALNATVGAGDMHMQDLADAFGRGTLVLAKGFGLSLRDVGAALAVFGDNNIRGTTAGTQLRMMLQSLVAPTKDGKAALQELGLSGKKFADDMAHGGLNQAILDLKDHLEKVGITGNKLADWLTVTFGKKAGAGIEILISQFDRLQSKYVDIDKGSNNFAKSWAATQDTFKQKWNDAKAAIEALAVKIGLTLLPILGELTSAFTRVTNFILQHNAILKDLGLAILPLVIAGVGTLVAIVGSFVGGIVAASAPLIGIAAALEGIGIAADLAYNHMTGFRNNVNSLATDIGNSWQTLTDKWSKLIDGFKSANKSQDSLANYMGPVLSRNPAAAGTEAHPMGPVGPGYHPMGPVLTGTQTDAKGIHGVLLTIEQDFRGFGLWLRKESGPVAEAAKHFGNAVMDVLKTFGKIGRAFWGQFGSDIELVLRGIWQVIYSIVKGALGLIKNTIEGILNVIDGNWSAAWHNLYQILYSVWMMIVGVIQGFIKIIGGLLYSLVDLFKLIFSGLVGTLRAVLWDPFVGLGRSIVEGIIQGIQGAWTSLTGMFRGLLNNLSRDAANAIEKGSPSRKYAREIGEPISQGIAVGIQRAAHLPSAALKKVMDDMFVSGAIVSSSHGLVRGTPNPNSKNNLVDRISSTLVDQIHNQLKVTGAVGLTRNGYAALKPGGTWLGGDARLPDINVNIAAPNATKETVAALRQVAQKEIATTLHLILKGTTAGVGRTA